MAEIILHHYPQSPFGEMVRLALGLKALSWKSVIVPNVSPKPDLTALTGGYERVPVLQIGADIYCDTACIIDALETYKSEPSLYPAPLNEAGRTIALWAGGPAFLAAVGAALGPIRDQMPDAFWADRQRRFGMKPDSFGAMVPHLQSQFTGVAGLIADMLGHGGDFIGGERPGHADLACYMLLWFQQARGGSASNYGDTVSGWYERVSAIGHGDSEDWTAEQAIRHAADIEPLHDFGLIPDPQFKGGDQVMVKPEGPDPGGVVGTLVGLDERKVTLERYDERAGKLYVHFPRLGQVITPA